MTSSTGAASFLQRKPQYTVVSRNGKITNSLSLVSRVSKREERRLGSPAHFLSQGNVMVGGSE
jgi:hypothetical protein